MVIDDGIAEILTYKDGEKAYNTLLFSDVIEQGSLVLGDGNHKSDLPSTEWSEEKITYSNNHLERLTVTVVTSVLLELAAIAAGNGAGAVVGITAVSATALYLVDNFIDIIYVISKTSWRVVWTTLETRTINEVYADEDYSEFIREYEVMYEKNLNM